MSSRRTHPDEEEDDEEEPRPRRTHPTSRRSGRSRRHPPLRTWSTAAGEDDGEDREEDDGRPPRRSRRGDDDPEEGPPGKTPVYFRARDSIYFEPLVALAVIVVLLVSLFAYTANWPPMYVVESNSMQHGTSDQVGLINTGDLVLAQKTSQGAITPYEVGAQTGYSSYGEYGDVILYHPNGLGSGAPIIHRALLYIEVNSDQTYSFPALSGQLCGAVAGAVYSVSSSPSGCGTSHVTGTLSLFHVGWQSVLVRVDLASLGGSSGFLTMGDNNFDPANSSIGDTDQPYLSTLVQPGWIVGVARGMLPWFGSLKLLLDGNAGEVPAQSWEWMGLTVVGLVLVALGIHAFLRAEGIEDERRKEQEEEEREARSPRDSEGGWRWTHPIRSWREAHEEEDEDEEPTPRHRRGREPASPRRSWFGGRPKPEVGRRKHSKRDSDDDL